VESPTGSVGELHAITVADVVERPTLWWCRPTGPGLALGSTQRDVAVDHDLARTWGVEVGRRRSGGGAVLLEPGDVLWVDLLVGKSHSLWHDDIGRAAAAVGELWSAALASLGVPAVVHCGAMDSGPWGALACFAGRGPGEVFVDDAKVVGISQRRTSRVARLQCAVITAWRPERLVQLLDNPAPVPGAPPLLDELRLSAQAVDFSVEALLSALVDHLPAN
jgi:lipoate-protein ligase A